MGRTGEVDFNRVLACVVVVAAHLAFFWVMTRKITLPLPAGDTGDALQLTWSERPASPRSPPPTPATTPDRRDRAPASTRDPPARAPAPDPNEHTDPPPSGPSTLPISPHQPRHLPPCRLSHPSPLRPEQACALSSSYRPGSCPAPRATKRCSSPTRLPTSARTCQAPTTNGSA